MKTFLRFDWKNSETWPADVEGHVFLSRAVDVVGRSIFPTHWTGEEIAFARSDPGEPFPSTYAAPRAAAALSVLRASGKFPDLKSGGASPELSDEQWQYAVKARAEKINARDRFDKAWTDLSIALASGRVSGMVMEEKALIPTRPLNKMMWNTQHVHARIKCTVPNWGYDNRDQWVFVVGASLAEAFPLRALDADDGITRPNLPSQLSPSFWTTTFTAAKRCADANGLGQIIKDDVIQALQKKFPTLNPRTFNKAIQGAGLAEHFNSGTRPPTSSAPLSKDRRIQLYEDAIWEEHGWAAGE